MITFVLPFFALIRSKKSYEVSVQMSIALAVFFVSSLLGKPLLSYMGAKKITWMSIALATSACFILSKESMMDIPEEIAFLGGKQVVKAFRHLVFFHDPAIAGYLLICLSIAMLTMASL